MAAAARAHMVPAIMPARKTWVEIRRDPDKVRVTSEHVYLRKSEGDEVEWFSQGEAYTVVFDKNRTPFADNEFHVSTKGSSASGPIVVPVTDKTNGDRYSYSIIDAKGVKLDPDVIIRE
jgi:hypothetical protein